MAITEDQIKAAVEKFLPRTLDVSRDSDSGSLDRERVVARALQIAKTTMLLNIEAPFYPLFLAVTSWAESLQSLLDKMAELASDDLLLSLRDEAPHFVDDLSLLRSARTRLSALAGDMTATGSVSDTHLDGFTGDLEEFVSDHILENVTNRNRVVIREEAKTVFVGMESLWTTVRSQKTEILEKVDEFLEVDLKSLVAGEMITAIRARISEMIDQMDGATSAEHAALAEDVVIDLAASRAVLRIVQQAETYEGETIKVGETVVLPVIGEEGSTPKDYLQRSGVGIPEPISVVTLPSGARFNTGGRIHLDPIAGGHGEGVDDEDGDILTDTLEDLSADFVVDGVEVNHSLFLVATASSYRITSVSDTNLEVSPEIPHDLSDDDRYLVLGDVLGTYFKDVGESFWTEYSEGESGSNVVVSGEGGVFREDVRLEDGGIDSKGYNNKDRREDGSVISSHALPLQEGGVKWPHKLTTHNAQIGGNPPAISGGYDRTTGSGTIVHSQLTGSGYCLGTSNRWNDSSVADFTTLGINIGDLLHFSDGPVDQWYWRVTGITSGYLEVDESARSITAHTGQDWYIHRNSTNYVVYDDGGSFISDGVSIGDYVWLWSETAGFKTLFQVDSVISEFHIMVDSAISGGLRTDVYCTVHAASAFVAESMIGPDYLYIDDGLFSALVVAGDRVRITTGGDIEGEYEVAAVVADNVIQLASKLTGYSDSTFTLFIHEDGYEDLFYDSSAEFLTKGVEVGDKLYLHEGSGSGTPIGVGGEELTITEVINQNFLRVDSPFSDFTDRITWHISPDSELFFNTEDVITYGGLLKDGLAADPGYKLVIALSAIPGHVGEYDLKYDPDDKFAYPEIGLYWLELDDPLENDAENYSFYSDWRVIPQDDKTWYFGFSDPYGSKIDFLDFVDDNGDDNKISGAVTYKGVMGTCYLAVGGEKYQVLYAVREDPHDSSSPAWTLRFNDRVDVDANEVSWEIWRGLTTDIFKDTTNSPFADASVGDIIRVDPNTPEQTDYIVIEAVSASEVRVAPELEAGLTGINYVLFNSVKPGMELVTGSRRVQIVDITDEHILKLGTPLPASVGKDLTWFVVLPGTDLDTTYLVDRDATFISEDGFGTVSGGEIEAHDWVEGSTVQITGRFSLKAGVVGVSDLDGDGVCEAVILDKGMPLAEGPVTYRVLDYEEFKTFTFTPGDDHEGIPVALSSVGSGDLLTVWGHEDVYEIDDVDESEEIVTLNPRVPAGLEDLTFAVCRGGARSWGRFLLLRHLLDKIVLNEDLDLLKLRLAEVVADFGGTEKLSVVPSPGISGSLDDDGDDDDTTPILHVTQNTDIAVGDQVFMSLSDDGEVFSYVKEVDHDDVPGISSLTLYHEFDSDQTVDSYSVIKNSVSYVLDEIYGDGGLYSQVSSLQSIASAFTVPVDQDITSLLDIFAELGMDSASNAVRQGDLASVAEMSAEDASYSSVASAAVSDLGQSTAPSGTSSGSSRTSSNVAGKNPDGSTGSSRNASTNTSTSLGEEAETRIALADLMEWLTGETRTRETAQMSLDDILQRALFALSRKGTGTLVTDEDPILPWIAKTGSKKDRLVERKEAAVTALDYMIEHPEEFEDVGEDG